MLCDDTVASFSINQTMFALQSACFQLLKIKHIVIGTGNVKFKGSSESFPSCKSSENQN